MKGFRQVSELDFIKVLYSKNQLIKDTNHIIEPPITFFWDKKLKDMSWGQGAFGAIVHDYLSEIKFYLSEENFNEKAL